MIQDRTGDIMRCYSKKLYMLLMLVSFLLVSFPVEGGENIHLKVVYTEWFPYTYLKDGQARGFEIETFKTVIAQMGITAEYTRYP